MATRYQRDTLYQPQAPDFSASNTASQLAGALSSFSRRMGERYQNAQAERGAAAGAQSQGTPKFKSNLTTYGRAYNNAAQRNYAIEQYTEIEKQLGRLENESAADPEKFQALADGVRKGMLKAAPAESRADISNLFSRRLSEGVVRLDGQRIKQQKDLNRGTLEQGLQIMSDSISRKAASGDATLMAEIEEDELHYDLMIQGGLNDGTLTPVEGQVLRNQGKKRVTSQVITGLFEREVTAGNPVNFLERLMDSSPQDLSDAEKQQLVGTLFTRLNQRNALAREQDQLDSDEQKAKYARGEKAATMDLLTGRLTTKRIESLVENDDLDPGVARTLQNELEQGGPKSDDDQERFHVETNVLEFSEDEIAQNAKLSWDTRRELIEKRRELSEGWRSTQQAREGAERIDRALGIIPGMDSKMLSKDDRRARDQALTEWYNTVDALPPEERQAKSIELSEKVITNVIRNNASNERKRLENRLAAYVSDKDPTKLRGAALKEFNDTVQRLQRQIEEKRSREQ